MADSVKNPEPDFIAGKFADIDYTGVEHQILAFDTFQQAFNFNPSHGQETATYLMFGISRWSHG